MGKISPPSSPRHREERRPLSPNGSNIRKLPHSPVQPEMYRITDAYLGLIREVGAKGTSTRYGELFTLNQLMLHLKGYLELKGLYNPSNPGVVDCTKDPLANVFGVQKFHAYEVLHLVRNQIISSITRPSSPSCLGRIQLQKPPTSPPSYPTGARNPSMRNSPNKKLTSSQSNAPKAPKAQVKPFSQYLSQTVQKSASSQVCQSSSASAEPLDLSPTIPSVSRQSKKLREMKQESGAIKEEPTSRNNDGYFHSARNIDLSDPKLKAEVSNQCSDDDKTSIALNFPKESRLGPEEQKTPVEQLEKWSISPSQEPSEHLKHALTFEEARMDELRRDDGEEDKDDEGVYDCEPSTSAMQPEKEVLAAERQAKENPTPAQSKVAESSTRRKRRHSSISIVYGSCSKTEDYVCVEYSSDTDDGDEMEEDKEEVLSVQSKETAVVKDSSDDFTDDEDDDDVDYVLSTRNNDRLSVHMGGISVHVHSSPRIDDDDDDDDDFDSISRCEETGVRPSPKWNGAYDQSDIEFFADSEHSEDDSVVDGEIKEKDKWPCEKCHTANSPLHRFCNRCYSLRPDWLPASPKRRQQSPTPQQSQSTTPGPSQSPPRLSLFRHTTLPFTVTSASVNDHVPTSTTVSPQKVLQKVLKSQTNQGSQKVGQCPSQNQTENLGHTGRHTVKHSNTHSNSQQRVIDVTAAAREEQQPGTSRQALKEEANSVRPQRLETLRTVLRRKENERLKVGELVGRYLESCQGNRETESTDVMREEGEDDRNSNRPIMDAPNLQDKGNSNIYVGMENQNRNFYQQSDGIASSQEYSSQVTSSQELRLSQEANMSQESITFPKLWLQPTTDDASSDEISSSPESKHKSDVHKAQRKGVSKVSKLPPQLHRTDTADTLPLADIDQVEGVESFEGMPNRRRKLGGKDEATAPKRAKEVSATRSTPIPATRSSTEDPHQGVSCTSNPVPLCSLCTNGRKDSVLIHGSTGHQLCCLKCAQPLVGKACPVETCRLVVEKAILNLIL